MAISRFPKPGHDHRLCLKRGLERARAAFQSRGERLTSLRETIFRTLAASHSALGAYDIIARLRERGREVAPISVYRVLESLRAAGLVHRLESRNAFVVCFGGHERDRPVLFMVCDSCGTVAESAPGPIAESVSEAAGEAGFQPTGTVLEVSGLCRHCSG